MKTKLFKQTFHDKAGHFFRLSLPVAQFESSERWETAEDAALRCDLFKLLLVRRYSLAGNTMFPSLPPERFSDLLAEAGVDRTSTDSLFDALPQSCSDFLQDGGHEELLKHNSNKSAMRRVIS